MKDLSQLTHFKKLEVLYANNTSSLRWLGE